MEEDDQFDFYFGGNTYEPEYDQQRLGKQLMRVKKLMMDNRWRTLQEIERVTGYPQASISARLRDLRKKRFGSYEVLRRRHGEAARGLFEYRLTGDFQ